MFLIFRHSEYQQDVVLHQLINQLSQSRVFLKTTEQGDISFHDKQVLRIEHKSPIHGKNRTKILCVVVVDRTVTVLFFKQKCNTKNSLDSLHLTDIFFSLIVDRFLYSMSQSNISDAE